MEWAEERGALAVLTHPSKSILWRMPDVVAALKKGAFHRVCFCVRSSAEVAEGTKWTVWSNDAGFRRRVGKLAESGGAVEVLAGPFWAAVVSWEHR